MLDVDTCRNYFSVTRAVLVYNFFFPLFLVRVDFPGYVLLYKLLFITHLQVSNAVA